MNFSSFMDSDTYNYIDKSYLNPIETFDHGYEDLYIARVCNPSQNIITIKELNIWDDDSRTEVANKFYFNNNRNLVAIADSPRLFSPSWFLHWAGRFFYDNMTKQKGRFTTA